MATTCSNCGNPATSNPCEDCREDSGAAGLAADVLAVGISDVIESCSDEDCFAAAGGVRRVTSFEADGVLTRDAGFTIRMNDGSEYQVTVVQSKAAKS